MNQGDVALLVREKPLHVRQVAFHRRDALADLAHFLPQRADLVADRAQLFGHQVPDVGVHGVSLAGIRTVALAYAEAGPLLIEAKAEFPHGQWLPFLDLATINERVAQRPMRLANAGMTADTIMDAGEVDAALRSIRRAKQMP